MAKIKTHYSCQNCGHASPKWVGKCPTCQGWNTFVEEVAPASGAASGGALLATTLGAAAVPLSESNVSESHHARFDTGISEFNRVLGGGLVTDSLVLIGGDPGIGKSTLLLQASKGLLEKNAGISLLYVSGEESVSQLQGRAKRLGLPAFKNLLIAAETRLEAVQGLIERHDPKILIIDSLQTIASDAIESAPGTITQMREVCVRLMSLAKSKNIAVVLVGHVTKDGTLAGPKVVEHMVDAVLYFEGDVSQGVRLLRTIKNRFGSSKELGVFEMVEEGLREVSNPSGLFLNERKGPVPGVAVGVTLEGSRPLLLELEALVAPTILALPRRTSVGLDATKISLLSAVLEKNLGETLSQKDLYFNVSGGLRVQDPGCDLAALMAIWSSLHHRALPVKTIWIGEVGLTGEVRRVSQLESRISEAARLGFKRIVIPANQEISKNITKICDELIEISHIKMIPQLLGREHRSSDSHSPTL